MTSLRPASACILMVSLAASILTADSGSLHQQSSDFYGTSGGNVKDRTRLFCCSGTLGSLITDGASNFYILSNNHVLARTNKASVGEDVSQPGMIDYGCRIAEIVGDLAPYPVLGTNVDAAAALLRTGAMSPDGHILDIGIPSSVTVPPSVGLPVAKSGRTTGLTTASIGAINVDVNVQYQQSCGQGKKFIITYANQIVISSSTFSAGGDSGSLIVTNDATHNPVGLLFAGSSTTTIANPIDEVLSQVSGALGRPVGFGVPAAPDTISPTDSVLSEAEVQRGTRAKNAHARRLMSEAGVVGVGVGADPANPGRAAVVIYRERGAGRGPLPGSLDDVNVVVVETDPIVAFGWKEPNGGCDPIAE